MTKFVRTLIIINGLIIPAIVLFTVGTFLWDRFRPFDNGPDGLIVGDDLAKAKKDSLALQGVDIQLPLAIGNSRNFYVPVTVKTYEEPRYVGSKMGMGSSKMETYYNHSINVLFLDRSYKLLGKLLETNASITEITAPEFNYGGQVHTDTTIHHITYLIAFKDTDKNGVLNEYDDRDLYFSKLDGTSLTRITTDWDVNHSNFVHSGKKLLISYVVRTTERDEYNRTKFALYDLQSGSLSPLSDIDAAVESIERDLNK